MKTLAKLMTILLTVVVAPTIAYADTKPIVLTPKKIVWEKDTEPGAPKGLMVAVLYGDPSKAEPYVVLVKFPASSSFPLHTHPNVENVTVLRGTLGMTLGSSDKSKGELLPPGSFVSLPANTPHFVWAGKEVVLEISGNRPDETKLIQTK